jgi:hypothetical protein
MARSIVPPVDDIALDPLPPNAIGKLCERCLDFDIQSFRKSPSHRRGYRYQDVKSNGESAKCEFCALLWSSVKGIEPPSYFYSSSIPGWLRTTTPEIYVHMTMSQNYEPPSANQYTSRLEVNRLLLQVGDRFSDVRHDSPHELCLVADEG